MTTAPDPDNILEQIKSLAAQHAFPPTAAERTLWESLRENQLDGLTFRQQIRIGKFIVAFCCPAIYLVIEIDSLIPDYPKDQVAIRQAFIESQGYRVLRFSNDAVMREIPAVLAVIHEAINNPPDIRQLPLLGE